MPEYLNNRVLIQQIERFANAAPNTDDFKEAQSDLITSFQTLTKNIIRGFRFKLIDADDMAQEGVFICLSKMHKYKTERGNCFSYFSTILLNHYRQMYRSAKNYNSLKLKYAKSLKDKAPQFRRRNKHHDVLPSLPEAPEDY